MAEDLNTDLGDTENDRRGWDIAAAMTEAGVKDMTAHFLPRKRKWGREHRTWSMVREGKVVRSRTDYLLGTDRSLFRNMSVRYPRYNTNHFMVVGCLRSAPARACARAGALCKQPTTMKWSVLCLGSRTDMFLKRLLSVPRR